MARVADRTGEMLKRQEGDNWSGRNGKQDETKAREPGKGVRNETVTMAIRGYRLYVFRRVSPSFLYFLLLLRISNNQRHVCIVQRPCSKPIDKKG